MDTMGVGAGKINVVGFGPGDAANMTALCTDCLRGADVVVGYTGYVELLRPLFPDKAFAETGMTRETERCRAAIELARSGKSVCVVSSGDSGVYGMASLILELAAETAGPGDAPGCGLEIQIVPGVTAALAGAALLGAPLANDFAVVSLSDLLTPWETIERRLRAAAGGDFAICLYNPGSHRRTEHLRAACDILLETLPKNRLCGIARNIGRDGQSVSLLSLVELRDTRTGMTETVFIGNSQTRDIGGRMITIRGYKND